MALDANIPLGFQPQRINTPFENLNIVLDSKRREQQVRQGDLELRQQEKNAADQEALQQIWSQYGDDPETAIKLTKARNPVLGMKMEAEMHDGIIRGMEIDIKKQQLQSEKIDRHLTRLISVQPGDDELWQHVRGLAAKEDPEVGAQLPEHLLTAQDVAQRDSVAAQGQRAGAVLKARLEEQNRLRDDARTAADLARKEKHDESTAAASARTAERLEQSAQATAAYQARMADTADRRASQDNSAPVAVIDPKTGKRVFVRRQQAYGMEPGGTGQGGTARNVTSGDANRISEINKAIAQADDLAVKIGSTGAGSQLGAALPNVVTEYTGLGADSKGRQATIDLVKQIIGKTFEGGVLRLEDEKKYDRILPRIGDAPAVAKAKIEALKTTLGSWKENQLEALEDAGYDTSRFRAREGGGTSGGGADTVIEYVRDPKTGKLVRK